MKEAIGSFSIVLTHQPHLHADVNKEVLPAGSTPASELYFYVNRAVFKRLSKLITRLRLLRLVISVKISCQFFKQ